MLASEICQYFERLGTSLSPHDIARAAFAVQRRAKIERVEVCQNNIVDLFERSTFELTRMNESREAAIDECQTVLRRFRQSPNSVTKAEMATSYVRSMQTTVNTTII